MVLPLGPHAGSTALVKLTKGEQAIKQEETSDRRTLRAAFAPEKARER